MGVRNRDRRAYSLPIGFIDPVGTDAEHHSPVVVHHEHIDGASDLFAAVLGDKAGHARSAFSQRQLPADAAVILVVIAEIDAA